MHNILASVALVLCFSTVHAQTPTDYDTLIQQGKSHLQASDLDDALTAGRQAIELDPNRWEAYALAGGALMNLRRYEEAADQLSQAIIHAPESKQAGLRDLRKQCALAEVSGNPVNSRNALAGPSQPAAPTQAEIVLWKTIENSQQRGDFETYLAQYPNGAYVSLATRHLKELSEEQNARRAAARRILPIETPLFQGTLIQQGGLVFVAIPSHAGVSSPVYMVSFEGQPAFQFRWQSNYGNSRYAGSVFFTRDQLAIRVLTSNQRGVVANRMIPLRYSDISLTNSKHDVQVALKSVEAAFPKLDYLWLLTPGPLYREIEENDDYRVTAFLELLINHWDETLNALISAGVDIKSLPDSNSFDIDQASAWWASRSQNYCMCPH
jgi:tetratricopeptide (TPR) repeat protein